MAQKVTFSHLNRLEHQRLEQPHRDDPIDTSCIQTNTKNTNKRQGAVMCVSVFHVNFKMGRFAKTGSGQTKQNKTKLQ